MRISFKKISSFKTISIIALSYILIGIGITTYYLNATQKNQTLTTTNSTLSSKLTTTQKELNTLRNENQYVKNQELQKTIKNIENTYTKAVSIYEKLLDLKTVSKNTAKYDTDFANSLSLLSQKNYASAEAILTNLNQQIKDEKNKIAASQPVPQNITSSNTAPSNGFSVQKVNSDVGEFVVYMVAADLATTKVIVDTASDSDCSNNCPTLPLSDYVARNGAYAGINGSYFCPAEYPSCAGKTNSFDLLVMNKNKHYFNSSNNVYSTNPAIIFLGSSVRYVPKALEWGRDTGVDSVLSNFPLLVFGDNIAYDSSDDPKFNSKGPRGFVANKSNTVYIGFVLNATMKESAHVLKTLGMNNAMNLDEGGSTALWSGGYKLGPGRNIPNAILFVRSN